MLMWTSPGGTIPGTTSVMAAGLQSHGPRDTRSTTRLVQPGSMGPPPARGRREDVQRCLSSCRGPPEPTASPRPLRLWEMGARAPEWLRGSKLLQASARCFVNRPPTQQVLNKCCEMPGDPESKGGRSVWPAVAAVGQGRSEGDHVSARSSTQLFTGAPRPEPRPPHLQQPRGVAGEAPRPSLQLRTLDSGGLCLSGEAGTR